MSSLPAGASALNLDARGASVSTTVPLGDMSRIGEARRAAVATGIRAGLSDNRLSDLGIVATELATNAVRHGGGGRLLARVVRDASATSVELLCVDRGPGMTNVAECMRDGFSTGGTMGTGLGAARRLADKLDVYSAAGLGTVVLARVGAHAPATMTTGPDVALAAICVPVRGETACGDGWAASVDRDRIVICCVDGLGHGISAADAADMALHIFHVQSGKRPGALVDLLHRGLTSSRGAAGAVAEIDLTTNTVTYAGLGNIAGWIVTEAGARAMVSHNGTLGHQARRVQEFVYPWSPDATLVMHSDGLSSQWKLDKYPGVLRRDPAILAAVLHRDFARDRDDQSIVVFRQPRTRT